MGFRNFLNFYLVSGNGVIAATVLMNALFDVGLRNFIPEILISKMSSEVVDIQ